MFAIMTKRDEHNIYSLPDICFFILMTIFIFEIEISIFELKLFLYEKATHTIHYPFAATGTWLGNGEPIYKREQGVA